MNKKFLTKTLLPISAVALLGGGIATSLVLSSCSNKSKKAEKALEINISHSTTTFEGFELDIEGSYEAFNINSPTIEFVDNIHSEFSDLHVDYVNKTFATSLRSNAGVGDYVLQLVANGNVFSNEYHFTVEQFFGAIDGSNWSGHEDGTVQIGVNNTNMTATITGNEGYVAENLIIPENVFDNGKIYEVTSIGFGAFENCSGLTGGLTIPNSVTSIGRSAFNACSGLTGGLTIPDSVISIGDAAFRDCGGLTGSLTIGNKVEIIDSYAFYGCGGLTGSLTIPNSMINIGDRVFVGCSRLTGSLTIPNTVIRIGNRAFEGCRGFINITLEGFNTEPNWTGGNIFIDWNNYSSSTVSSINGILNASAALAYLMGKDLPNTWTPV